ncbi:MAG: hypothetical protein QM661_11550 [Solimonas sp.]
MQRLVLCIAACPLPVIVLTLLLSAAALLALVDRKSAARQRWRR